MTNENDLMMKLVAAKQIMNKHNEIGRGGLPTTINDTPRVETNNQPKATYNIPQEYMNESMTMGHMQNDDINYPLLSESAMNEKNLTKTYSPAPSERIMSSKLPDAIKQLMIEHPIHQPDNPMSGGVQISNELVEKASRLMNTNAKGEQQTQRRPVQEQRTQPTQPTGDLKTMVMEAVREVLSENGLITESVSKANDVFSFRVGSHIFEGKVTKIKKIK
jgi:hypothetical protein